MNYFIDDNTLSDLLNLYNNNNNNLKINLDFIIDSLINSLNRGNYYNGILLGDIYRDGKYLNN